jgi:iron complex outermembrane receptor protein
MTYASVARGFRGGGINPPGSPNLTYRGDSVWTYELGAKTNAFDGRLSLDADVFLNDYQHFIGQNALAPSTTGVGFVGSNLNSGHVISPGFELESRAQLTRQWSANAGLTLLHSRIIDTTEYVQTTGQQASSNRILFLPDWNFNLGTNYVVPLGADKLVFDAGLIAKGNRQGSTVSANSVPTLHTYYVASGSVIYRHRTWEVALFGSNLLDQKYFETYIDKSETASAGFPPPLVNNLGIIGDRRRMGVRGSVRF